VALAAAATALLAAATASCGDAVRGPAARVSFSRQIQPLFDQKCISCHPSSYPYLDLRLGHAYRGLVGVPAATAPSYLRVLPGRPGLSYLLLAPEDPSRRGLLSPAERRLLAAWIRQGAEDN
jgi:hypothetical protein